MEYHLAKGKNEILAFSIAWMDLEDIMLNEIIRERKIPI